MHVQVIVVIAVIATIALGVLLPKLESGTQDKPLEEIKKEKIKPRKK